MILADSVQRPRHMAAVALATAWIGALPPAAHSQGDLPAWNEGAARDAILEFVAAVTDETSESFVPVEERVAVFDNDGTLWVEKPTYTQVFFMMDQIRELSPQHPDWATTQPYRAVIDGDMEALHALDHDALLDLLAASHTGVTQSEFEAAVADFFASATHPRFDRPFQTLVYQPMVEVIGYLEDNDFTVYIVSAGGLDFMRGAAEEIYGIPPERVIGTSVVMEYQYDDGTADFVRQAEIVPPMNDRAGKPVTIQRFIGRQPIIAFGNSDGDIEMLEYTMAQERTALALLVHHDDADREYDYDTGTESALTRAQEDGWVVISMEQDFAIVLPPL